MKRKAEVTTEICGWEVHLQSRSGTRSFFRGSREDCDRYVKFGESERCEVVLSKRT